MKYSVVAFIILGFFALNGCEKDDLKGTDFEELTGTWINPQWNDTIITYQKSKGLKDNEYGFSINANGKFIERKNAGFCGTPPVTYADYEGTWSKTDSLLIISVGYWGGTEDIRWKIISLSKSSLSVAIVSQELTFENK